MKKIADFEEILPKLTKLEIFSDFDSEKDEDRRILKTVYDGLTTKNFKKGEMIIREGDRGDDFYILHTGSVQVQQNTFSNDRIALANLDSTMNIFFGEAALIGQDTRSASVIATSDCSTIVLSGEKFLELAEKEPVFGYRVTLRIARRMAATIRKSNRDKSTLYEALLSEVEGTFSE